MGINQIEVRIKGISALLMHAFPLEPMPEGSAKLTAEEQAKYSEYRDPDTGILYIPGIAIQRCFVSAASYSKGKGRASLQKQVAACLNIVPERVSLRVAEYIIDSRPVVIPATKGRIMRHRPRLDEWNCSFIIEYDDGLLSQKEIRKIVDDAGSRVGLLDFRPEKKGPFGRFMVTQWE
jgi:hypothetical protein